MWLLIFAVVAAALLVIQVIRVNSPRPTESLVEQRRYTARGNFLPSQVEVAAHDFSAHKIDLNRRMRLLGSFHTGSFRSLVSIVVVRETDFENWKRGVEVKPIVKTNFVPGGKLAPTLEPDAYYVIVDNRDSDQQQVVTTDFVLE